jgi:poly-gamma-glutamate synthesis protein (capsule biosynthesis protein)
MNTYWSTKRFILLAAFIGVEFLLFLAIISYFKISFSQPRLAVSADLATPKDVSFATQKNNNVQPESFLPLDVNKIFAQDHSFVASISARRKHVLIATGDVLLARSVNAKMIALNDFTWPFRETGAKLRSGDITLINLETPLLPDCKTTNTGMTFCGDERNAEGLVFAGVDVVNLANNHTYNYGDYGIQETKKVLGQNNILYTGLGEVALVEHLGITFGFLGYNDTGQSNAEVVSAEIEKVKTEVEKVSKEVDVTVISIHWGNEYTRLPTKRQKMLARIMIDAGADLIIGNHPHWVQPIEFYGEGVVVYAHGNFVFDQMMSMETRLGVVGVYTFFDEQLVDIEFLPIRIDDYGQPKFIGGNQRDYVLDTMKNASMAIGE